MKLNKGEQAKQNLIEIAAQLFLKKGYSNTGINDILHEANMSKGSFYFYFSSKKELGLEVAKYYGKTTLQNWLKPLSNNPWDVFIPEMICDLKSSAAEGTFFGCPIAALGLEVAFIEAELSAAYLEGMKQLIGIFSNSLEQSGLAKTEADQAARKAFAIYEGYVLYYRISKEMETFDHLLQDLLSLK